MSNVGSFVSRITAEAPSFKTIAKAWTTTPIKNFKQKTPAALVYLAGVESEENAFDTGFIQDQTVGIGVIIVCDSDSLEAVRDELQQALAGWEIDPDTDSVEHEDGQIIEIQGGVAWWTETFSFRRQYRA